MSLLSTRSLVMRACAPRLLGSSFSRAPLRLTHSRPFTRSALVAKDVDADGKDTLPGKAGNIIESMLYGSKKIKEEEEQTYSKKLARGKYVHELQSEAQGEAEIRRGLYQAYGLRVGLLTPEHRSIGLGNIIATYFD
ncbi:hypothetical protein BC936DRAFT_144833 [Jimgerdemannia flammicorona]|uniref:Uncharacterized protein n=1 Tax=Jimgerdemannia flammicorona TaxID=994334 RepID=A0A433DBL7_9FUNG|nr:hypothetical protein BC936DRAFT_144833 [Jimgerdemannia flammicorona]